MALILKHPTSNSKGVIIFTHKELDVFCLASIKTYPKFVYNVLRYSRRDFFFRLLTPRYYEEELRKIRKSYFIGAHFGRFRKNTLYHDFFDFVMCSNRNLPELPKEVLRFDIASRDFIPDIFFKGTGEKFWDIINVSRALKLKNLDKFMHSIRKLYDRGIKCKVLLVVATSDDENEKDFYLRLADDYYKMFNAAERENITLLKLHPDVSFPGIPAPTIAFLMRSTKVLTLYSEVEGSPKVVTEGLLAGCRIVVYDKLQGGGLDHINDSTGLLFSDFETADQVLEKAMNLGELNEKEYQAVTEMLGYQKNLNRLIDLINEKVYRKHGMTNESPWINTDQLHRRLPAHLNDETIPWNTEKEGTSDIFYKHQFEIFKSCLKLPHT